jgi:hypothetical protein
LVTDVGVASDADVNITFFTSMTPFHADVVAALVADLNAVRTDARLAPTIIEECDLAAVSATASPGVVGLELVNVALQCIHQRLLVRDVEVAVFLQVVVNGLRAFLAPDFEEAQRILRLEIRQHWAWCLVFFHACTLAHFAGRDAMNVLSSSSK